MATLTQTAPQISTPSVSSTRMLALDVFRGMTIAAMILVNDAGDWSHIYWPLEHAEWNGWTPTDLVFPFFLFIVGISMVLSFGSRTAKGATRGELMLHSVKRAAIIFGLGLFLNGYPSFDFHVVRIAGVLQRIAVVYLIASALVLYTNRVVRAVVAVTLLLGYWMAMKFVPVPSVGAGVLTMDGNLAGYIDRALMYNHLYIEHLFDPEGVLSTIPAIVTCLLGVFTTEWMRDKSPHQILRGFLIGAIFGIGLGKIWSMWFPINKNLWTSSYVLFTAGCALALLAACYWLIDIAGWKRWAQPFVWFGVNPLAIYFAASWVGRAYTTHKIHGVLVKTIIWKAAFEHLTANPYLNSVIFAACFTLVFWVLAWALYRKKIFIRV